MRNPRAGAAGIEYLESRVWSAGAKELVEILYDAVLAQISSARRCLAAGDPIGRSKAVTKAVQGLTELILSLNADPGNERTQRLKEVYAHLQSELLQAHAEQSESRLARATSVLEVMHRNWREVCSLLNSGGVAASKPVAGGSEEDLPAGGAGPWVAPESATATRSWET